MRPATSASEDLDTRERILMAAIDVFAQAGYEGTSVRDICRRAGVNGAAMNYHWRSKAHLWTAVCDHVSERIVKLATAAIVPGQSVRETVRRFLGALFDAFAEDPAPIRIFAWTALQAQQVDFDQTVRRFQPIIDVGTAFAAGAQSAGLISKKVDVAMVMPLICAQFIFTFIDKPGHLRWFGKDLGDPEHAARVRSALIRSAELLLGLD